jgi:UDP-galactopyranose mutase
VLAQVDGRLVPIPINLTTINRLYGLSLAPAEAEAFLAARVEPVAIIRTAEDVVVSQVGRELYDKFFRGYTRKQWGMDPSELDKAVTSRVPTRTNTDDRYFSDSFQNMPLHGYSRMVENMLNHRNIEIMLNVDFREIRNEVRYDRLIYTGPIDEFFDCRFGKLPYRSLHFRHETLDQEIFQPVAVVNYPSDAVAHTRITEYKHLTGQKHPKTSITYEYPAAEGDPTIRCRGRRTRRCSEDTRHWPTPRPTSRSWGGWPPTATTTWTRWWRRRSPPMPGWSTRQAAFPACPRASQDSAQSRRHVGRRRRRDRCAPVAWCRTEPESAASRCQNSSAGCGCAVLVWK